MKLPRYFYRPDGGSSSDNAEAALDHTFGPLSGIRPDLAAAEAAERDKIKAGIPPKPSIEDGRPILDSERAAAAAEEEQPAKPKKEEPPDAAPKEPPAEGEAPTDDGSDLESPDEDKAALEALLAKYQGKPLSMAQALREMRSLQTKTAEEKKELEDRFEAAAAVIDADYEWQDGKPVLRADVAARSLQARRGSAGGVLRLPTEAEVRAQVEEQFKEKALETIDEDSVPQFLAKWKPVIDQTVTERLSAITTQVQTQRMGMQVAVGDIINRHLASHPEHKDLLPDLDKFYAGIPEEARTIAFLEEWLPFSRIADLLHTERSVKKIATDAYNLGKKARGQAATVTESGSPGKSRPVPTNGRGSSADVVKATKEAIIRGSGLPSIDELFAK